MAGHGFGPFSDGWFAMEHGYVHSNAQFPTIQIGFIGITVSLFGKAELSTRKQPVNVQKDRQLVEWGRQAWIEDSFHKIFCGSSNNRSLQR
jgi:hypothetical protein